MKIAATDLDRTLLQNNEKLSEINLRALYDLKSAGFITVIATGRNLYSCRKVISPELPFDYLIFASGCGVIEQKSGKIIYRKKLEKVEIEQAVEVLMLHQADFMIHQEIPDNHFFQFYQNGFKNEDFHNRIELYKDYASPWQGVVPETASQILAVIPAAELEKYNQLKQELDFVKVIRTTSPLDHTTVWLEIFPADVSKGHTLEWLCKKLQISRDNSCSLGNDYNDIDMLNWTRYSYLVDNAPAELKTAFRQVPSNQENGFAVWVEEIIKLEL
jgi:Cof subfamily protein (haloacid dehalogenase superfamily)